MKWFRRTHVAALLVATALLVLVAPKAWSYWIHTQEDLDLQKDPSAEKAYEYANTHFDARSSLLYDIDRAEYLYEKALELEPSFPNARHQLGRIAFLRGDLDAALFFLDAEIAMNDEPASPSSYYMRGLIKGYMGRYEGATVDYEAYLAHDPDNWAALTDYAWVLLKADRPEEALEAAERGLAHFPENAWLLNGYAIALSELGRYDEALGAAEKAAEAVKGVTENDWLTAYPGNDPKIAREGMRALRSSIESNVEALKKKVTLPQ